MENSKQEVLKSWDYYYPKLVKFKLAFGHCDVPADWKTDKGLAQWVTQVRQVQSRLSAMRRKLLMELGFQINYDLFHWNQMYEELKAFSRKNKHASIPSTDPEYKKLYNWMLRQRKKRKDLDLSEEQLSRLNKAGFIWERQTVNDTHWENRFKELAAYERRYGDCLVPRKWPKNPELGKWVEVQRTKQAQGKMRRDRKARLDALGFLWSKKGDLKKLAYDKRWKAKYKQLIAYKNKYGHTSVPYEWKENPHLARWVADQRAKYHQSKLYKEQISELEAIGFIWNPVDTHWAERCNALAAFKKQFGHVRVPESWKGNKGLGKWASYIRGQKENLSPDKIRQLDALGFDWKKRKRARVTWMDMYKKLVRYQKKHGHTRVKAKEDKGLRKWVYDQRIERTPLNDEKRKLLEAIGFEISGKKK